MLQALRQDVDGIRHMLAGRGGGREHQACPDRVATRRANGKRRGHHAALARRSAFRVTTSDEPAMPRAAMKGVTRPLAASGMASRL